MGKAGKKKHKALTTDTKHPPTPIIQPQRIYGCNKQLNLVAALEVVQEDVKTLRLNTKVADNDARGTDDLTCVTLSVDLAETSPGTQNLGVGDLDEVDLVLCAESFDELNVLSLSAGFDEHTEVGSSTVESLSTLSQTTGETIVVEGVLENLLEGFLDRHLACWSSLSDFDLFLRNFDLLFTVFRL